MRVRYTRPALADLEALLGSISARSPQGARRLQSRIQTFIELLADYPFIGARTDDPSIRRLPIPPYPYLIFYEVIEDEVAIHTVRHAARDPSSMSGSGKWNRHLLTALPEDQRMSEAVPSNPDASRDATLVRAASEADMAVVRDIYAHYVLYSHATFEETPPTLDEMLGRRRASVDLGLPYLVAEARGEILGFAYAAAYRARPAYRFTIEDSVYVAEGLSGQGIGSALLEYPF